MALEIERLLAPVSDESPAGPDLAYDPARYEIEQVFETAVSIDASGVASAGQDVDWRAIIASIARQSEATKDLWLAVYLCRAGARAGALDVVATGAEYLAGLLEDHWAHVHPQLEEYGFQGRKGACDALAGYSQFLTPLMSIPLLEHPRLGRYSAADFERFRQNGDGEDGYGLFRAALEDTEESALVEIVQRIDAVRDSLRRADRVLTENAGEATGTNFTPTYETLEQMKRAVSAFISSPAAAAEAEAPEAAHPASDTSEPARSQGGGAPGRIESREDVIKALDAISDYYRRKEPASPLPLLLQRARDWVPLDFMSVLEDIAPSSLDEARLVLKSRRQQEEY